MTRLSDAGYLEVHMRWAAREHPAFDDFHADMLDLHARLENATALSRRPTRANADCFDCGGQLIRRVNEGTVKHVPTGTAYAWWLPGKAGPLPPEPARTWKGPLEEEHATCDQCGQTYDPGRYMLALRAQAEAASRITLDDGHEYATLEVASALTGRQQQTLRNWITQGRARRATLGGVLFINLDDANHENQATARRNRSA